MFITNGSTVKVTLQDNSILEGQISMISFCNNENFNAEIILSENAEGFENSLYGDALISLSGIKAIEVVKEDK